MEIGALAGLIILITWLPVGLLSIWLLRKMGFGPPEEKRAGYYFGFVGFIIFGYVSLMVPVGFFVTETLAGVESFKRRD
jgi:hypothetical protein